MTATREQELDASGADSVAEAGPGTLLVPHGFEANYVVGFARGLAANGIDVTVLSSDEIAAALERAGVAQRNIRGSQTTDRSRAAKAFNLVRYYLRLLAAIFRFRGRPIHFNGLLNSRIILVDGLLLPLWLRLWAGRYIHTAHNALPHSRERSRLFQLAYRWVYRFPHVIVAHTDKVARQLQDEFGVPQKKLRVISIGLNEEVPDPGVDAGEARRALGLPGGVPLVLFFGKIEPYKGVDVLVSSWAQVREPTAQLVIAGQCPDRGYAQQIRTAIDGSAARARIAWREGFVPNEQVALLLRACDAVVMPYRHIYQSGVVFLCLRFGVPIVATNVGSLPEYIDDASGIIADTNDATGIARALDRFFARRPAFNRDAIARHALKYGWKQQCHAIHDLYV